MVPPNINFWSISRKEILETKQKHALKKKEFCEHYCVPRRILIPDTTGKCSLGRVHQFLTKVVLTVNSCFIQYKALLVKYNIVAQ